MSADSGSLLQTPETNVVVFPSSSMGQLTPLLRLAALLLTQNHCPLRLTVAITHPTVSVAESALISRFLSAHHDKVNHSPRVPSTSHRPLHREFHRPSRVHLLVYLVARLYSD
ncbi:hypothetical protein ACFX2I_011239 [Malus domestica]